MNFLVQVILNGVLPVALWNCHSLHSFEVLLTYFIRFLQGDIFSQMFH